jgi:hypothetical protein
MPEEMSLSLLCSANGHKKRTFRALLSENDCIAIVSLDSALGRRLTCT